jgi:hypothetical protein
MKVWVKKQENDKQVSRTVSERHVERMAKYENTREEQLLTMHSNSKTQALTVKFSRDAGVGITHLLALNFYSIPHIC